VKSRAVDPDPDPIRIQGVNGPKTEAKNYSGKFVFIFFYIKNCSLLGLGLCKERPSLRPQKITFTTTRNDPYWGSGSGYGLRDPIESGSNSDPDPQHWCKEKY
jgi:hypothetical protein